MGKIVAIGGGNIGRPGTEVETLVIDWEIICLSGKQNPRLLFIPTASSDAETYCEAVRTHFGDRLGCKVDNLLLLRNKNLTLKEISHQILSSDIIYVGGGNTLKMLIEWRRRGIDDILLKAYQDNIVLSGLSAGAICWFRFASSDSRKFRNPDAGLIKIKGLNLIPALCCPHYDTEADRPGHVRVLMSKTPGIAIALDNCSAIEIVDDQYRILDSLPTSNAHRVYWCRGQYYEEIIEKSKTFKSLSQLLSIR